MWHPSWTSDIIAALVSDTNPEGTLTNSDLKIAALNLQEATLPEACSEAILATPRLGSDNATTVSCSTREAPTIKPVVVDLLRIRTLYSRPPTPRYSTT